jgi:minor extracellular protease Epr
VTVNAAQALSEVTPEVKSDAKPATPKKLATPKAKAGKKQIKVTWKKSATKGISGYEVQYRVVGKKWVTKKLGAKATSVTIKKLKPGKKYEVRVRAFSKSSGKVVYGPWSKTIKSGKVKR